MIYRIFVEKKDNLQAKKVMDEARNLLSINDLQDVRYLLRYDVEGMSERAGRGHSRRIFRTARRQRLQGNGAVRRRLFGVRNRLPHRSVRPACRQRRPVRSASHAKGAPSHKVRPRVCGEGRYGRRG